jgi:methionyl-tRNA formyltransferase
MGSPDFALPSLDALAASSRFRPALVVTQPDRARGRGKRMLPTAVKARAQELDIPVRSMSKSVYRDVVAELTALRPEVIVVVAFGVILKRDLLALPRLGCINVHASLLPKYRGVSPIQAALLAGENETGCTTMLMDEGVDTGGVLMQATTVIHPDDTAGSLSDRLSVTGADLLIRTLEALWEGSLSAVPQDDSLSTYSGKIRKEDGHIEWSQTAVAVERRVRAMSPWPNAFTFYRGSRLIIVEASPVSQPTGADPGTIVSTDPFLVACGEGSLEIHRLKPEGKKAMTPGAFMAGHACKTGERFGGGY